MPTNKHDAIEQALAHALQLARLRAPDSELADFTREIAAARAKLAEERKVAADYIGALERYGALARDDRTKTEQALLLSAADAYAGQV